MKLFNTFCFIFFVALLSGNAVLARKSYRHEALKAQHERDTATWMKALKFYGDSLSEAGEFNASDSILIRAVSLAVATADRYETGILYNLLATNASYSGNRPLALSYYHKALKEFYDIRNADKVAMIMMNMGSEYEYAGNLKLAIAYKLKALENKIASGNRRNLDYYYQHIGQLFKETDADKWEKYVRKAYEVSKTLEDSRFHTKAAIFNDLGGICKLRGRNDEALAWYDSMLHISVANKYLTGQGTAYSNRSLLYMSQQKYDKALNDILKAISIADSTGKVYAQILDRIHAANILEKMKRFDLATQYATGALAKAKVLKYYPEEENQAHLALARIGEGSRNWKMAYEHYNAYKEGMDSLRSADVEKNMHDLEVKYQTAEKEKEIERLDYENRMKTIRLERWKMQLIMLAVVVLSLAAIWFLWSRRKLSENRKQQAELREKLLRSQMNPHFIFNTLNAINQYVQADKSSEASDYLTRYARLMRQILEYSTEKYIVLSDEIELLTNYLLMQQLRFGNRFSVSVRTEGDLDPESLEIPPMIAQPFVENAVEHGVRGVENGRIEVVFALVGKKLILTVTDNGRGIQESSQEHRSMALNITRERLHMQGNSADSLLIESPVPELGCGTRVRMVVPCKYDAES
ncbi:MAG: hypothetical protein ABS72_00585 [Paludibacter sp. SCN 50-10]|nr:MAG: hypothetical protein ABS72_00585 [Paludibacter sp. SCN 50-10]